MAFQYDRWSVDQSVYDVIAAAAHEFGVPLELMMPVAGLESGFTPWARGDLCHAVGLCDRGGHDGDGFCSFGLYQFNRCGGAGTGHAIEDLLDPAYNARLAAHTMRYRYDATGSWWEAIQPWSTRPGAWALFEQYGPWDNPAPPVVSDPPPSGGGAQPPAPGGPDPVTPGPGVTQPPFVIPKPVLIFGALVGAVVIADVLFPQR